MTAALGDSHVESLLDAFVPTNEALEVNETRLTCQPLGCNAWCRLGSSDVPRGPASGDTDVPAPNICAGHSTFDCDGKHHDLTAQTVIVFTVIHWTVYDCAGSICCVSHLVVIHHLAEVLPRLGYRTVQRGNSKSMSPYSGCVNQQFLTVHTYSYKTCVPHIGHAQ